jgi:hypothetical protein
MKKLTLVFVPVLCLLVSCSPKVTSTMTKTYPSLSSDTPVKVFYKENIPAGSEEIGQVRISDTGFSTDCDSLTVISRIKHEARKAGGNAVLITEHRKPSIWGSSCHQMTAVVLNVSGFSGKSLALDDVKEDAAPILISKSKVLPRFNLAINGGYGWRTAKLADNIEGLEKDYIKKLTSGPVWNASANYYFNDNYGVGFAYSAYSASNSLYKLKSNDMITYAGPAFLMRFSQNQKWIFNMSLGLGYIGYSSTHKLNGEQLKLTGATVGFETAIGAEYKFSENWGVGATLSTNSGLLNSMTVNENGYKSTIDLGKDEKEGLGQIRIALGFRYYIK